MPSLNALGEFKFSFSNIGNEKSDLEGKNAYYHDLPLPTTEAAPMDLPSSGDSGETPVEAGGFDFGAFLNSLPADVEPPPPIDLPSDDGVGSADGASFFGGSQSSDDLNMSDLLAGMDLDAVSAPAGTDEPSTEDLLSGFDPGGFNENGSEAPPPESSPLDSPFEEPPAAETETEDLGGIDLGGEGIDLGGEFNGGGFGGDDGLGDSGGFGADGSAETGADFDIGSFGDAGVFADSDSMDDSFGADGADGDSADAGTDFDMGGLTDDSGGIDLGGEFNGSGFGGDDGLGGSGGFDAGGSAETGADFDIGSFGDAGGFADSEFGSDSSSPADDAGTDSGFGDSGGEIDLGGLSSDFGGDFGGAQEAAPYETGADAAGADAAETDAPPIDLGDLGADFSSDLIDLGSETEAAGADFDGEAGAGFGASDFGGDDFSSGEFALEGIDDLFDKPKTAPIAPKKKKSFWQRRKEAAQDLPEAESDIEEIQLSESDTEKLLATIASYPLNLRIACEELIAEQAILPQQLSRLINHLINGAHARQTANLVEEITGKPVVIPKSFEKMTGAAFEAEQASFAYIFVHNFLPVFRLFLVIAAFIACVAYLGYRFIYIPIKAEGIYKRGYEQILESEYQRANQLFDEAFALHKKKKWFYIYAEAFIDKRRYTLAEEKYDKLLENYPRDKKGVLDYAYLNTYSLLNYEKANRLLQENLLNYAPNDYEGLLAAGDNFMRWADSDPERFYDRYEDARFYYARLLELKGWQPHLVERMLIYFIHTDNLKEVLALRQWYDSDKKRNLSTPAKAELAGYLLDKQMQEIKGVPDPYLEGIQSVRLLLLEAINEDLYLPESHYHLARYHKNLNQPHEERLALENAIRAFNLAKTETVRRRQYRVDTQFRYSNLLVNASEFFPAEDEIVKGIELFEDFLERNLIRATAKLPFSQTPQLGQLYAAKGDIEYFVKSGNMRAALNDYHKAESYGYAPPEIQYRMGSAYYQLEDWRNALEYLFEASKELPLNRRVLYALGNAAYKRNDYFAAQGYYNRLLIVLENQRARLPVTLPNNNAQYLELGERIMIARNNMGAVYEALADQTGNRDYRSRAMSNYMESSLAWDSITRNPETMTRMRLLDTPGAPSVNQGYLNAQNALRPNSGYTPQIFIRIDKDALEPSRWEELAGLGGLR